MNAFAAFTLFLAFSNVGPASALTLNGTQNSTAASAIGLKEALNLTANLSASPVSRVVKLLKYLSDEIEKEGDYEEDLFEKFICWGKDLIKKTDENMAENVRLVKTLEASTKSLQSADVSITNEKENNKKEVGRLRFEIMEMEHERNGAKAEFDAAQEQMTQAIAAMEAAIAVLSGTVNKFTGTAAAFLGMKVDSSVYAKQSEALSNAVTLAGRFLDEADANFVRRVLTAQVPVPKHNWNKLNKKAVFKSSYKARSAKIVAIFQKILEELKANLATAISDEATAAAEFVKLNAAKRAELEAAQKALEEASEEKAAKLLLITKMTTKTVAIQNELKLDEALIKKVEADMKQKTDEWAQRKIVRADELKAIAKTVEVLHNDDARDAFTTSYKSQGYLFLQQRASALRSSSVAKAADELTRLARESGDKQLVQLAASVKSLADGAQTAEGLRVDLNPVINAIGDLIAELKEEEVKDLAKKEDCEKDREEIAGNAVKHARDVDDDNDAITQAVAALETYKAAIVELDAKILQITKEMEKAEEQRAAEKAAYEKDQADDLAAVGIVNEAKETLKKFYDDVEDGKYEALVQANTQANTSVHYAPPKVWTTPTAAYTGRQEESNTILYMMHQIANDITAEMEMHTKDENDAITAYDKYVEGANSQKATLETDKQAIEADVASEEGKKSTAESERTASHALMVSEKESIKELEPGCMYYTKYFGLRRKNRLIEIDGLEKARTFLLGGIFENKNRALTVGDN